MKRLAPLFGILALACVLVGCGSGETSNADLDKERATMEKQTPSNLEAVEPPKDTVDMGSMKGGGGG
ncbi:MAG: hypothetical protein IT207_02805 [Fimbriimonadaceae bacterium]|nr:hypothetical protein [Fimbriimonadaceae bacterium]